MHDYIHSVSTSDLRFTHTTKNDLHWFVDQFDIAQGISLALKNGYDAAVRYYHILHCSCVCCNCKIYLSEMATLNLR